MLLQKFGFENYRSLYKDYPLKNDIDLKVVKNKTQAKQFSKFGDLIIAKNCKEVFLIIPDKWNKKLRSGYRYMGSDHDYYSSSVTDIFNLIQGKFTYFAASGYTADRKKKQTPIIDSYDFKNMYRERLTTLAKNLVVSDLKELNKLAAQDLRKSNYAECKKKISVLVEFDELDLSEYIDRKLDRYLGFYMDENYDISNNSRLYGNYRVSPDDRDLDELLLEHDQDFDLIYSVINGATCHAWKQLKILVRGKYETV